MDDIWILDDITWCMSDCDKTECFRHLSNKHKETIRYSGAYLKDTELCPYKEEVDNND